MSYTSLTRKRRIRNILRLRVRLVCCGVLIDQCAAEPGKRPKFLRKKLPDPRSSGRGLVGALHVPPQPSAGEGPQPPGRSRRKAEKRRYLFQGQSGKKTHFDQLGRLRPCRSQSGKGFIQEQDL